MRSSARTHILKEHIILMFTARNKLRLFFKLIFLLLLLKKLQIRLIQLTRKIQRKGKQFINIQTQVDNIFKFCYLTVSIVFILVSYVVEILKAKSNTCFLTTQYPFSILYIPYKFKWLLCTKKNSFKIGFWKYKNINNHPICFEEHEFRALNMYLSSFSKQIRY